MTDTKSAKRRPKTWEEKAAWLTEYFGQIVTVWDGPGEIRSIIHDTGLFSFVEEEPYGELSAPQGQGKTYEDSISDLFDAIVNYKRDDFFGAYDGYRVNYGREFIDVDPETLDIRLLGVKDQKSGKYMPMPPGTLKR